MTHTEIIIALSEAVEAGHLDADAILNAISAAIVKADSAGDIRTGDSLFEVIQALRQEWELEREDTHP